MRTKRRYAHELYPHPDEYEVRSLAVEVPYLYAIALGMNVWGTDWFDLGRADGNRVELRLSVARTIEMIGARRRALHADAIHQGLTGQDAWEWAESRMDEEGGWVYDRAVHYGVDIEAIKPYPVLDGPDHHQHLGEEDTRGFRAVTRLAGKESECPVCCEPPDPREPGPDDVPLPLMDLA